MFLSLVIFVLKKHVILIDYQLKYDKLFFHMNFNN